MSSLEVKLTTYMCIGCDNFLSGSLIHELTFRIHWNNIEGATSLACCELPHQCIYKQCITGQFASRSPDHPGRHSGLPGWFIRSHLATGRPYLCSTASYQYRKSHCGDKTVISSSYLHNGISYTGKMASLYWTTPLELGILDPWKSNGAFVKFYLPSNLKHLKFVSKKGPSKNLLGKGKLVQPLWPLWEG